MAELLLELFSEEIPARMQQKAAQDLCDKLTKGLSDKGVTCEQAQIFATPRRLTVVLTGLPKKSPAIKEERKGPRVGAPEKALEGFMRAAGIKSIDEADIVSDPKKGDFYQFSQEKPGEEVGDLCAKLLPEIIRNFPWPKSMRWGAGQLRWVRPLHSIICLLDGKVLNFDIDGIASGNETQGHRFLAPKRFKVKAFDDYKQKLRDAYVLIDSAEREAKILEQAQALASKHKLKLVEDKALLAESAGLVEWPTVLIGQFEKSFLDVPQEALTLSMKKHQKCFSLMKGKKLSNHFLLVSNLVADDGGAAIIAGNERVIRARLSDAQFFWQQDKKKKLDDLLPKLDDIVFHEKLGTQGQRAGRLQALSRELAPIVGADAAKAARAAQLCKADLVTDMVGEFADLQGLMGRYYALEQGEDADVAAAIEAHYKPQGPTDEVPNEPVSIAIALADKLDTLVGFWAIDEKPTGSKDPFALRRAALGVIRIILENEISVELLPFFEKAASSFDLSNEAKGDFALDLLSFFADRLKVYLRDQGARHDLIDAVFSLGGQDNLLLILRRVEALAAFLASDDGANLLAGTKRAANILRIEEKKDKCSYDGAVSEALLQESAEESLYQAIVKSQKKAEKAVGAANFTGAMEALADLRGPVDAFFDQVTVNDENAKLRQNRLNLLNQIRLATLQVADFSKIEG